MRFHRIVLLAGVALLIGGCSGDSGDDSTAESGTAGEASAGSEPTLPEAIPVDDAPRVKLEDRLASEIQTTDEPDWMVDAFGSLWTIRGNGDVLRIDPGDGRVIATVKNPSGFKPPLCQGIGASDDSIWACPASGKPPGTVVRIDPDTNKVVSTLSTGKIPDQGRLISAAGQLWLLTGSGETLTGVDLETEKPTSDLPLGTQCTQIASQPPDEETLWALCPSDGVLLRIDPTAPEITGELELDGAEHASVAGDVWVAFDEGIAQVDPESLEVDAVYGLAALFGGSMYATEDEVWVREEGGHFLARIDPAAQRIVETIEAPKLPAGGDVIVIGDSVWATAYDQSTIVELQR